METPLGTLKEVYAKTKTLIVKDLEGLLVVPPVLITVYNLLIYNI